jgi:hypothetical protein
MKIKDKPIDPIIIGKDPSGTLLKIVMIGVIDTTKIKTKVNKELL